MIKDDFENFRENEGGGGTGTDGNTSGQNETPQGTTNPQYNKNYAMAEADGNPSVNLALGRLRYIQADLGIGYGNYAVQVNRVYNSVTCGKFAGKTSYCGTGWKLNLSQYLVKEGSVVYYLDELGETHKFVNFDTDRYYDELNAKTVLYYSDTEKYISDGVGNKLYFDTDGYLSKSVSCYNASIAKIYEYDANKRLVRVYDQRHAGADFAKRQIEFYYTDNLLTSVVSSYNGKKQLGINYVYENGYLTAVSKVTYALKNTPLSKVIAKYTYENGKLVMLQDTQSKTAVKAEYSNNRVSAVISGVITDEGVQTGMPTYLGIAQSGVINKETFIEKTRKQYSYSYVNSSDEIALSATITNENGISLVNYLDREGRVISTFEKDGSQLKTLQKQGAKKTNFVQDGSAVINGCNTTSVPYVSMNARLTADYDVARNVGERKLRKFQYSFWLKTFASYPRLKAVITCYQNGSSNKYKTEINGKAPQAWQYVSVPIDVPIIDGEPYTKMEELFVSLESEGQQVNASFEISDVGFTPSVGAKTYLECNGLDNYIAYDSMQNVKVNGVTYPNDKQDTYFTPDDLLATYNNVYRKKLGLTNSYDCICNNGRKRIAVSANAQLILNFGGYEDYVALTYLPIKTVTELATGDKIETYYRFCADGMDVISGKAAETFTEANKKVTRMDYFGCTSKETDEYGVSVNYKYDGEGNLIEKTVTDVNGNVGARAYYIYEEGKLVGTNDGQTGQKLEYDEYEQLRQTEETTKNSFTNEMQGNGHRVRNGYGIYRDKPLAVSEYGTEQAVAASKKIGDGMGFRDFVPSNRVTYENGSIRTVEDATVKYGVQNDLEHNKVTYTQFDGKTETPIQTDSVTPFDDNGRQTHQSYYYKGEQDDITQTVIDKYGKVLETNGGTTYEGLKQDFTYTYDSGMKESRFVAKPILCKNALDNSYTTYNYDEDGNLTGWEEYERKTDGVLADKVFAVQKVADTVTKYNFGGNTDYLISVIYDDTAQLEPRVSKVKHYFDSKEVEPYEEGYLTQELSYDSFGRTVKVKQPDASASYEYEYDSYSRITKNAFTSTDLVAGKQHTDNFTEAVEYTPLGDVKKITQNCSWYNGYGDSDKVYKNGTKRFYYDKLHRITREQNDILGKDNQYTYDVYGRLFREKDANGSVTKEYSYNSRGQLSQVHDNVRNVTFYYSYDNYGNRVEQSKSIGGNTVNYKYTAGDKIIQVNRGSNTIQFEYNAEGVRCSKTVNGAKTRYFLDGNKVLYEKRSGGNIQYFYGTDGVLGFIYQGEKYYYVKDVQGNVVSIMRIRNEGKALFAHYEYDIWGNCTVYDRLGNVDTNFSSIGNINPFRWKGFYYDMETELYYANGSYYDPQTGKYLDASHIDSVFENAYSTRSLDRNGLMCNNVLELEDSPYTVETTVELSADLTYDRESELSWIAKAELWVRKAVVFISKQFEQLPWYAKLVVGIVLTALAIWFTVATKGSALGIVAELALGIGFGVVGYAVGTSALSETFTLEGLGNAILDAFFVTSIFVFVVASVNGIKYACRTKTIKVKKSSNSNKISDLSYDKMLPNEKVAYDGYSKHGWKGNYPGQANGINAGKTYMNKSGILPSAIYKEFDINPAIAGIGRDGSRFVVSDNFTVYLTRDHYMTFFKIIK